MVAYKSKGMHVEDDALNLSLTIKNRNKYPRENIIGDNDSSSFIPNYGHFMWHGHSW